MHPGSRTTPLTDDARAEFASFAAAIVRGAPSLRHVIVGNEPNLNRFWLPQFGLDGSNAASPAYLALLAQTYDALKAVSGRAGLRRRSLAPRRRQPIGVAAHALAHDVHPDLGIAYRASGRDRPVMDAFAIHPYPDNSSQAPTVAHPLNTTIAVADYGKLVALLGEAFDGDRASRDRAADPLRRVRRRVGDPRRQGSALHGNRADDDETRRRAGLQAATYEQALALAFCQPNVEGMLLFLSRDEHAPPGSRGSSTSTALRRRACRAFERRSIVRPAARSRAVPASSSSCDRRTSASVRSRRQSGARSGSSLTCDLDCRYWVRLENDHALDEARRTRRGRGRRAGPDRPRVPSSPGPAPTATPYGSCIR